MQKLYRHQQAIVDLFPKRHLLAWQVRTGKTLAAISLANKAGKYPLIIVPKQLKKQWDRELGEHLSSDLGYCVITKENFRAEAKQLKKYDTLIVDEAHHFSGQKSILSRYLEAYIKKHNPEHIYFLTGTPYRSTPWNIYRLAAILGHKWKWVDFRHKFFTEKYLGKGVIFVPRKDCQEELAELVRTIGSIVRLEDCTDMPKDPVPIVENVPMTDEQRALIKEVAEKESNPLVRVTKMHQVASGILIGNEYQEDRIVPCEKDKRIIQLIEEYDRGIVFCRYNLQIERYRQLFEKEGIPYVVINGATKDVDAARQSIRDMKYGAALINISCSEGYALHEYSLTVYASLSYSFLDFEQSQGRTKHMEKTVPNLYVILNTESSIDVPVFESISNKQSFSEAIFTKEHLPAFEGGIINEGRS